MSSQVNIKQVIVYKRNVYVIRVGPMYIWHTISYTKDECLGKAFKYFKVKTKHELTKKGAEIVVLLTKEVVSGK